MTSLFSSLLKFSTSGEAQSAAIDKSPLPPINPEAAVPDNEDLGFSRPKTSNVTRSPRKLPKLPDGATAPLPPPLEDAAGEDEAKGAGGDDEAQQDGGDSPVVTTEKGTGTSDIEGHPKEEGGGDDDNGEGGESEWQTGEEPDQSAAAAVPSKTPSKSSLRSSAKDTVSAGAAEVEPPKEEAKGSRTSVRSISLGLHKLSLATYYEVHVSLQEVTGNSCRAGVQRQPGGWIHATSWR